jgi:hypothetical protein
MTDLAVDRRWNSSGAKLGETELERHWGRSSSGAMEEHERRQGGRRSGGARKEELMWIMGRRTTGGVGVRRKLRQSQGPMELSRLRAVLLRMGEEEHRRSSGSHRVPSRLQGRSPSRITQSES